MTPRTPPSDDRPPDDHPFWGGMRAHPQPKPLTLDVHETFEIGIVLRGQVERRLEDYVTTVDPGDVWLNAAWEPHAWRTTRPNTTEVVCHSLPEFLGHETIAGLSWLAPFIAPPGSRPRAKTPELRELTITTAYEVVRETERHSHAWLDASRLAVLRLLLGLMREWKPPLVSRGRAHVRPRDLARLHPAIRLVQREPTRHITRDEAAAACGLSISQFGWLFQHTLGMSFGAFCMRARLASVAKRLLDTRLSLEAIASECGFSHGSHLHRLFTKYYRRSPGKYRELGRKPAPTP